jgi:hypothetical protein
MSNYSIKVAAKDILDYVLGNSGYDPIERCIDPSRFIVSESEIFDNVTQKVHAQNETFFFFYSELKKLRSLAKQMDIKEIQSICDELEQIAPESINLQ